MKQLLVTLLLTLIGTAGFAADYVDEIRRNVKKAIVSSMR